MNKHHLSFLLVFVFYLFSMSVSGQKKNVLTQAPSSDSLKALSQKMFNGSTDMVRYEANDLFISVLKKDLRQSGSFNFAFDSVHILSTIASPDEKFRIFTWTIPLHSDAFETYGLMMVFSEKSHNYKLVELKNVSRDVQNPEKEVFKKGVWYGAVYYQLVEKKYKGEKFYTLIGWNGADALYQEKVVDIVMFDRNDEPVFGKLIFRGKGYHGAKRLIFRYSDKVVMKLRYEELTYKVVTKKEKEKRNRRINTNNDDALKTPKKRTKTKYKTEELIVFDKMVPVRPELEGQYQYYYPMSETANAFYFEDGRWVYKAITTEDDSSSVKKPGNGLLPDNQN